MWFKVDKTLRGVVPRFVLLSGEALDARIKPRRDSLRITTRFGAAITGSRPGDVRISPAEDRRERPYAYAALLRIGSLPSRQSRASFQNRWGRVRSKCSS